MIRINLLNSAVENTHLDVVESAISNRGTQQMVILISALALCLGAIGLDWFITKRDYTRVKAEVDAEQATADRLVPITKQAKELQDKNKAVEERINAIMRLRAEQTGPLRLLQMMDGRMPADTQFRLTNITQTVAEKDKKEDVFTIMGYSPNEAQVTQFAKNLEFSDGWFSKFTLDIGRIGNPEAVKDTRAAANAPPVPAKEQPKDVIRFTIKCAYLPQNLLVNPTELGKEQPAASPQPPPVSQKVQ